MYDEIGRIDLGKDEVYRREVCTWERSRIGLFQSEVLCFLSSSATHATER